MVRSRCAMMISVLRPWKLSMAFMMTVKDVTETARLGAALNYRYAEAYIVILLIYLMICLILELVFKSLEKYLGRHKQKN